MNGALLEMQVNNIPDSLCKYTKLSKEPFKENEVCLGGGCVIALSSKRNTARYTCDQFTCSQTERIRSPFPVSNGRQPSAL